MTLGQFDCSHIIINKAGVKWKLRRTTIDGKNALAWLSVDGSAETEEAYISGTSTDVSSNTEGEIEVGNLTLIYPYNGVDYKWQLEPYNDSGTYKLLFKRDTTIVSIISDPTNVENNSYTLGTYELGTFKISGNSQTGSDFYIRPYYKNLESILVFFEDSISDSGVKYHLPLSTISSETVTNSTTSSTTSGTIGDVISLVWQMSSNLFPSEISSATFANTAVTSISSSDNKNYTGSITIDSDSTSATNSSLVITLMTGETVTKSISFEVITDTTPPLNPAITNSDSTVFPPSSLTISGTCSSDTDTIKIYNTSGTLLHTIELTIGITTWSQAVTLSSGTNTYKATALDTAGNESGYSNLLTTTFVAQTFSATIDGSSATPDSDDIFALTSNCTFVTNMDKYVTLLVVGGGGSGAGGHGGGGGAGGVYFAENLLLQAGSYSVVIGSGGTASSSAWVVGVNGNTSSIGTYQAIGGGGGGHGSSAGLTGGSGGGGSYGPSVGGSGSAGSSGGTGAQYCGGGGGGYSGSGGIPAITGNGDFAGSGGAGFDGSSYFGTSYGDNGVFAGGGGGGGGRIGGRYTPGCLGGTGGSGGGGDGIQEGQGPSGVSTTYPGQKAYPGTASTGGGGGGGGYIVAGSQGGDGGSGIILLKI